MEKGIFKEDLEIKPYDVVEYLNSESKCLSYLQVSLEEEGIEAFQEALLEVAKAKMIAELAQKIGFSYQKMYETLAKNSDMSNETLNSILKALNLDRKNFINR